MPAGTTSIGLYNMLSSPSSRRSGAPADSMLATLTTTLQWFRKRPLVALIAFLGCLLLASVIVPFFILDHFSSSFMPDATSGTNQLFAMTSSRGGDLKAGLQNALGIDRGAVDVARLAAHGHDYSRDHTSEAATHAVAGVAAPTPQTPEFVPAPVVTPSPPATPAEPTSTAQPIRAAAVVEAFKHTYSAYERTCMGQDEYHPLSRRCSNWVAAGLTLIDALPTMMLMGPELEGEVTRARAWITSSMKFSHAPMISFFETTIRVLGGLIAAHDLSGGQGADDIYLKKARELGDKLLPACNTATGLPRGQISLGTGQSLDISWTGGSALLAEIGTFQMEFAALSQRTGDSKYAKAAQKPIDLLDRLHVKDGLYPIYISTQTGKFTNDRVTWGAMGDSAYEYLLKMWLLTGRKDQQLQRMYRASMAGMFAKLWTSTGPAHGDYWYIADLNANTGRKDQKMDHLVCWAAGMLALGVEEGIVEGEEAKQHLEAAKQLMRTCFMTYDLQPTKIGPEFVTFNPSMQPGSDASYKLRPEMVESLFILYRVTRDEKYRDWGWQTFEAINKHCRVAEGGYVALRDVRNPSNKEDKSESFFLAETLKYLWLLFQDDSKLAISGKKKPGEYFVFNTEAHPIKSWA